MPFSTDSVVLVQQVGGTDDTNWIVKHVLDYEGKTDRFEVPDGFETDFASVPKVFAWFLPRYGRYTRAAILHDTLWQRAKEDKAGWRDADALLRRAMREDDVPFLKRWVMWAAVRWGALVNHKYGSLKGWLRDAPLVVLVTLLALPVVAPPAIFIFIALVLFFLYECVAWLVLAVGRLVKDKLLKKPPVKQLNAPSIRMKL